MENDIVSDESIRKLAGLMHDAVSAHERGVVIDDSMTFEQAKWLNVGRKISESVGRLTGAAAPSNVVDAKHRFKGEPQ